MKNSFARTRPDEVAAAPYPGGVATAGLLLRTLVATASRIAAGYRQRRRSRLLNETLCRLDDRTLRDLGWHRSEVAVFGAVVEASSPTAVRSLLALHAVPR